MPAVYDATFGCELSTNRQDGHGYAFHGRTRAHIAAWIAVNGAVPEGLVLDHGCRRRHCVALIHLEPVTQSENERRKSMSYRLRRVACRHGVIGQGPHRMVTPEGGVCCRACRDDARDDEGAKA